MAGLVGKKLDHYRLLDQIGVGGMATVYRAVDERQAQKVAIKVLSPTISSDRRFVRRFRREGGLVSRLKHNSIVPVIDYGEFDGLVYLVMPFVEGESLHERMVRAPIRAEESARWIGQVVQALTFAHRNGVIHRDIKPSNILITKAGDALLTDFGLARLVEGTNSLTGSALLGTPAYVSPEQARGQKLDERSDQYSLAVVLYQLSTGRLPFEADTPMATAIMHIQDPVPPPTRYNPRLPEPLERVILTALAKDPKDRFESVEAMYAAYQAGLQGDPLRWLNPTVQDFRAEALPYARPDSLPPPRRLSPLLLYGVGLLAILAVASVVVGMVRNGAAGNPLPSASNGAATATLGATDFAIPTATIPPTPAPPIVSELCPGLSLIGFTRQGNDISVSLSNATGGPVRVLELNPAFEWGNPPIEVEWGGDSVWALPEEALVDESSLQILSEGDPWVLADGEIRQLDVRYKWPHEVEFVNLLALTFDAGCTLELNW